MMRYIKIRQKQCIWDVTFKVLHSLPSLFQMNCVDSCLILFMTLKFCNLNANLALVAFAEQLKLQHFKPRELYLNM